MLAIWVAAKPCAEADQEGHAVELTSPLDSLCCGCPQEGSTLVQLSTQLVLSGPWPSSAVARTLLGEWV